MSAFRLLLAATLAVALTFLTLPVVAIFVDTSPGDLIGSLGDGAARDALLLSLETTAIAVAVIVAVGTPAAWLLATRAFIDGLLRGNGARALRNSGFKPPPG